MSSVGDRGDEKANEQMTAVQKKTFTRWMNHFLSERMMKVEDLFVDLKDGKILINLLEIISSKKLPPYTKQCKLPIHEIGNLNIALGFIKEEGLKLVNIDAQDIQRGNPKLVLGLIWTLILRYQIQMGGEGSSPKQELLDWVNKQIAPYEHIPQAKNFTDSWQDGKILSALTDSLSPGVCETKGLSDPLRDCQNAMNVAEKQYAIPQLVDAADMVRHPDEHSNMTYIACFRDYMENKAKQREQYKTKGPFPDNCFAKGKGVEGGFARRPLPFTIHSRTQGNQPVVGKWIRPMEVKVVGPTGAVPCEVRDNADGTFFAKYTPQVAGDYKVSIQVCPEPLDGAPKSHIKGSVYALQVREPSDPTKCWAEGPGLVRVYDDKPGLFTVYCRDKDNKPVPGDNVEVKVTQIEVAPDAGRPTMGDKVPVEVKDNNDGSYSVKYDAIVPGKYRVLATVSGDAIRDMPIDVMCYRAPDPQQCIARGPGVTPGKPRVGIDAPFAVVVKDRNGNPIPCGGHDLKVKVTGPSGPIECKIEDDNTGVYSCVYKPKVPGDHVIDVKINNQDIKDAPFRLNIKKPADPSKSYAEGPGLIQAWDNKPNKFKVHALDEDGKPVSGEPVVVTVTPKDGKGAPAPVEVKDNGDGTYDVAYNANKPGDYIIDTRIRGDPIKDMPKEVRCYKGIDPTKSIVEGPGVEKGFVGRPLPFIVRTMDKDGKPVPVGGADMVAKVLGPRGAVPCDLKDNGDGTYSGVYKPDVPGDYKVTVILDKEHPVGKSPYTCKVKPGASPQKSFAVGRGWKEAYDALPTLFTIYAKDENGEPVPGEKVRVVMRNVTSPAEQKALDAEIAKMDEFLRRKKEEKVRKIEAERKQKQEEAAAKEEAEGKKALVWTDPEGDVAVEVRDNGDGSYLAQYTAARAGKYEIHVTVSEAGLHIKESPKPVPVHLSKPKIVFWKHTYAQEKDELTKLRKTLQDYEGILRANGLLPQ
jgi:filamin